MDVKTCNSAQIFLREIRRHPLPLPSPISPTPFLLGKVVVSSDSDDHVLMQQVLDISTPEFQVSLPQYLKMYQRKRKQNPKAEETPLQSCYDESEEDTISCGKRLKESNASDVSVVDSQVVMQSDPKKESLKESHRESESPKDVIMQEAEDGFLTKKQMKDHLMSLEEEEEGSTFRKKSGNSDRICQLCASGELLFAPEPIYCSDCGVRVKERANYYSTRVSQSGGSSKCYCFCSKCYKNTRSRNIKFGDVSILKARLEKKKNDETAEEAWVRCNRCEGWQHRICGLFNEKSDVEAEYLCFKCLLEETEYKSLPKRTGFGAKNLPRTSLSDHIEERLIRRLREERQERMSKVEGDEFSEVLGAQGLVVREVLSVRKTLKVKQQYLDVFEGQDYPAEFPYSTKVILMFQKIDGVDVCLFGMYVQEFGSECSQPNKGCVYISYLDSVKYFRPADTRTVTGEALRTFVYHEILIGYLESCKKRGFVTSYIWACPPSSKDEDYIMYCHPTVQKMPLPSKLRKWYQSMIKKATIEQIVVGCTKLYDRFWECQSKVTAAHLPYFDSAYWSMAAENEIKEMGKDENKGIRKRTLEAMGHKSDGCTKDILLMKKLGDAILAKREDFLVVDLQYVCTFCNEAILSGEHWSCNQCKNFHLCERCHNRGGWRDTHISANMEQHVLLQEMVVENVRPDTKNGEVTLSNGLLEERQNFLNFCAKNHYQFDTLRHAKYSSIMVLHHLLNIKEADQSLECVTQEEKAQSSTKGLTSVMIEELLHLLDHASSCYPTKSQPCSYSNKNCLKIKKMFFHAKMCTVRVGGGCKICSKAWLAMKLHSKDCKKLHCKVPRCMDLKNSDQNKKNADLVQRETKDVSTKLETDPVVISSYSSPTLCAPKAQWLPEAGIWASPYTVIF